MNDVLDKDPTTIDHLNKLEFLNTILRDILRLHGPVRVLSLTPLEGTEIGDRYAIEKGEIAMGILQRLYEDPKVCRAPKIPKGLT